MPTYKFKYGQYVIDGGLFLKSSSANPAIANYTDGKGRAFKHLSTFPDRSTIKEALLDALQKAKRYVFFTSFLIQDGQIIEALIDAAERLRGHVYVLTTLKDQDFKAAAAQDDDIFDDQENFKEHIEGTKELVRRGISVKARTDCHAKFAVFDDRFAIITSANSTSTCFDGIMQKNGWLRQPNTENGVLIQAPAEVLRVANFFRAIWRSAYNYYLKPNKKFFDLRTINIDILPIRSSEPSLPSTEGQVIWTAPEDCRILNNMLKMIESAQKSVCISSYILKGVENHRIGERLIQAAKRGVNIEFLLRGVYRKDHLASCLFLTKELKDRVVIRGDFGNHSKALLVDNKQAMLMSANIDAQHGLDSSVEVGYMSTRPSFVKSVAGFLDRLRSICGLEFIANPKQHDAALGFPTLAKPILSGDLIINADTKWENRDRQINRMISAMKTQLIRVAQPIESQPSKICLLTDTMHADCERKGQKTLSLKNINETPAAVNIRFQQILHEARIEIRVS